MKLIINYDFFEAVRNANDPLNTYKVVRNNKHWIYLWVPTWTIINMMDPTTSDFLVSLSMAGFEYGFLLGLNMIVRKSFNLDLDKSLAIKRLNLLAGQFQDLNINTTYDLLLKSELYEKKNKIHLNESKIPFLVEHKYILVPTHDTFIRENKEVSIEQEHVVGSREYVLSLGKPEGKRSYSYSFA